MRVCAGTPSTRCTVAMMMMGGGRVADGRMMHA